MGYFLFYLYGNFWVFFLFERQRTLKLCGEDLGEVGGEGNIIKIYCVEKKFVKKKTKLHHFRDIYPFITSEVNTAVDNEKIYTLEFQSAASLWSTYHNGKDHISLPQAPISTHLTSTYWVENGALINNRNKNITCIPLYNHHLFSLKSYVLRPDGLVGQNYQSWPRKKQSLMSGPNSDTCIIEKPNKKFSE